MRAFHVLEPGRGAVREIDPPTAAPDGVVVTVASVGICGTDVSLFRGAAEGAHASGSPYPLQLGHEWCGTVTAVGADVDDSWLGRRVTGDTMLGCGHCERCTAGRRHLCEARFEIGIRGGWPGALAEQLPVPAWALRPLPPEVGDKAGAMVEPGGNAYRAVSACRPAPGSRVLVLGPGAIGLLAAQFARDLGCEVHVLGRSPVSLEFARTFGFDGVWTQEDLPRLRWDAVIEATDSASMPQFAVDCAEPGGRVSLIGISDALSAIDSRVVAHKELTLVGVLGASAGLAPAIEAYASGAVNPDPLVAATVRLEEVESVLSGSFRRPVATAGAPKVLVNPALT